MVNNPRQGVCVAQWLQEWEHRWKRITSETDTDGKHSSELAVTYSGMTKSLQANLSFEDKGLRLRLCVHQALIWKICGL
jgi:hypothetical protein